MTTDGARERALHRLLLVLRPYLPDLVLIGGWVPHLYRRYGGFAEWKSRLSGTAELDVLVTEFDDRVDRAPLATILRAADLEPEATSLGAVWTRGLGTGEKIEFFVPHDGMPRSIGKPRRLAAQEDIGAIQLTDLDMLRRHTRQLTVPVRVADEGTAALGVVLPTLGAYLVAKASTFMRRTGATHGDDRAKRPKDIVYMRDVMAASKEVVAQVERDIDELRRSGYAEQLRHASNQLSILSGASPVLDQAAHELAERDGLPFEAARMDLEGYVADLRGIVDLRSDEPISGPDSANDLVE